MTRIVAIGASEKLLGWALAGAELIEAPGEQQVRLAWNELDPDVGLVLLTPEARKALPDPPEGRALWVVLPE
jgi:vacuolar-type H+-ATPase subunit F/Vma7